MTQYSGNQRKLLSVVGDPAMLPRVALNTPTLEATTPILCLSEEPVTPAILTG